MSAVFFTPSQSRHLYNKKRKTTALSIPLQEGGIAAVSKSSFRWVVLTIVCFAMFVYSYCYDNPVALQNQLQTKYNLTDIQYNLLYSAYTFPNMILPFFSGILADIFSADLMIIIFFLFILFGQVIFVTGCIMSYYPIMFIGRFLFGIGAESFSLVITPLIYEYFRNKELSLALGLLLSLSRIGSSVNDYMTFYIYHISNNIIIALSAGLLLLIIGLFLLTILLVQRYSVRYVIKKQHEKTAIKPPRFQTYDSLPAHSIGSVQSSSINYANTLPIHKAQTMDITQDPAQYMSHINKFRDNKAVSYDENAPYYQSLKSHSHPSPQLPSLGADAIVMENKKKDTLKDFKLNDDITADGNDGETFKLKDIKEFDLVFWLLVVNCGFMYGVVLSFMNIGSDYLQTHYGYSHREGNTLLMIPYVVGAILTPILGYISDKIGKRAYLLLISTTMLIGTHYLLAFGPTTSIYFAISGLIGLGVSYSVFCAVIWPSFALVVPDRLIGTGYGIPCVFYNTILSLFYLLVGVLTDTGNPNGKYYYQNVEIFLLILSVLTTFTVACLIIADKQRGSRLNIPTIRKE